MISPLTHSDLQQATELQPPDWGDIVPALHMYIDSPWCEVVKVSEGKKVIATGGILYHRTTAWLAHIIVHPDYRNRGTGKLITQFLMDAAHRKGYHNLLLLATDLGAFVYEKLGFKADCDYIFFDEAESDVASLSNIITFNDVYRNQLLSMDLLVSGEDRSTVLHDHLAKARLFVDGNHLMGFYLPTLNDGLIVGGTEQAGLELLKLKLATTRKNVLPESNEACIQFLLNAGAVEQRRAKRMYLSKNVTWQPQHIYSRISGSMG